MSKQSPSSLKCRWKLHLCPKHLISYIDSDNDLPPLPPGKSVVDVLSDFIKYLCQCAKTYIQEHHPTFPWSSVESSIEYVLTYPGGWSEQQSMYHVAIVRAGLVPSKHEGQPRVHMVPEGEAALHFYAPHYFSKGTAKQTAPQGVVVVDAGGGTVDLSMFSITPNPISFEEVTPAECMQVPVTKLQLTHLYLFLGRIQGSVFVTRRAGALLQSSWPRSLLLASD